MYELNDTIVAVSSATLDQMVIIRTSGPKTGDILHQIFSPYTGDKGMVSGSVAVDGKLRIDAKLYLFLAPHSYTGETVAEIHIHTNSAVTETLMATLLAKGLRGAGPGEFTARAYLNGKIDLAQAEAVNEIIVSSNKLQLKAAEKLLAGRLSETTEKIRAELMDSISLIEAGLDFSGEDIEFITCEEGLEKLTKIKNELGGLLSGSISYEAVIDLPAVAIAGAPNAGKSRLLNKLLGRPRSIVSEMRKTTRDVLSGQLTLQHCRCVLFDCAGLMPPFLPSAEGMGAVNILDELSQHAAVEAIRNSALVIFCIDTSKTDYSEDTAIRTLIEGPCKAASLPNSTPERIIPVATKCDLLSQQLLAERLGRLNELFGTDFLATSAKTGAGIEKLTRRIDKKIIELSGGSTAAAGSPFSEVPQTSLALTARHKQAVTEAIEHISDAIGEMKASNDEITAMMLRSAYQAVTTIEHLPLRLATQGGAAGETIDERILETIFSRFCIGK